jgi:hypothetical protein
MQRGAAVVSLAGISLVACSYILELPSTDVSLASSDAAPVSDGATGDADPAPVRRQPAPPFCASQTAPNLFCADFDATNAPDPSTVGSVKTQTGQVSVIDSVSQSPPRALLATASGASSQASVLHTVGASPGGLTVAFDVLVSTWQTTQAQIAQIALPGASSTCAARVVGASNAWSVVQECSTDTTPTTVTSDAGHAVETNAWRRFVLSVKFDAPKRVTLDIDGVRVVDVGALDAFDPSAPSVTFGVDRVADGTVVLFQDNLLITSP